MRERSFFARRVVRRIMTWILASLACASLAPAAMASTASLEAQQVPIGLVPDVSSLARFPASALSISPGLYADLEAQEPVHAVVLKLGAARSGVLYDPLPLTGRLRDNHAAGGFFTLPVGHVRIGAAIRAAIGRTTQHQDACANTDCDRVETESKQDLLWLTVGAGVPLGEASYVELSGSFGQLNDRREHERLSPSRDTRVDECPEHEPSFGAEARWKVGLHGRTSLFGLISFRREDTSQKRFDLGVWSEQPYVITNAQPSGSDVLAGAAAVRTNGPVGAEVTAGLSAAYTDSHFTTHDAMPYRAVQDRDRSFGTEAAVFAGAAADLRRWLRLYGGLTARYGNTKTRSYRRETTGDRESRYARGNECEDTGSRASAGLRMQSGGFYVDAVITDDFGADDPFGALSVGYRF